MSVMIKQSVLYETKWFDIRIGSSIVTFCERCICQRTHTCADRYWVDGGWVLTFLCDFCRFNMGDNK